LPFRDGLQYGLGFQMVAQFVEQPVVGRQFICIAICKLR
jgi:hypothetical protein